jgi:hypothetical protein
MTTKTLRTFCLVAVVAVSCILLVPTAATNAETESSVSIIGGADGPTAIFFAGKLPGGKDTEDDYDESTEVEEDDLRNLKMETAQAYASYNPDK